MPTYGELLYEDIWPLLKDGHWQGWSELNLGQKQVMDDAAKRLITNYDRRRLLAVPVNQREPQT